jgi:hydroxymethylpyrimidine/phosphomethylpyrimidine kinase
VPIPSVVHIGALYPTGGLIADALASHAVNCEPLPVCTSIAMASHGRVTDVTDVPADTVRAQLDHLSDVAAIDGVKIGALAGHHTAEAVFNRCEALGVPMLLDVKLSGASGETVLTARGIDVLRERMGTADLVVVGRTDAELLSGGVIESLDDAQVAAQRIARQCEARALVIKCGALRSRFFEPDRNEDAARFSVDLFYAGGEFALFEAPYLSGVRTEGASSAFAVPILKALIEGRGLVESVQEGKRFVSEALRATRSAGTDVPLQYFWEASATQPPPVL